MKKLLFLFAFIALVASVNAQTIDGTVKLGAGYASYTGTAADTINGATTVDALFRVEAAAYGRYQLSFFVSGDTLLGGTGNVTIQAQGSYEGVLDFDNVGSAVTWTYTNGGYDANTVLNTYTEVTASATDYVSGVSDTVDTYISYGDTTTVAQRTTTITLPGVDYRYIKILLTGASGARVDVDKIAIKCTPIMGKF